MALAMLLYAGLACGVAVPSGDAGGLTAGFQPTRMAD